MKKIDYEKLQKDSIRYGVSVYTLVKRELNYRKVNKSIINRCCFLCKNIIVLMFDNERRRQCNIIGASKDKSADIEDKCICDAYK